MKRIYIFLFGLCFFCHSCTEDCYIGNNINEQEAIQVIKENEFNDPLFSSSIIGDLSCVDNKPMTGLSVKIRNDYGYEFILESGALGSFNLPYLEEGTYVLKFSNPNLPIFSVGDFEKITTRLGDIISGIDVATNLEKIAYNLINYDNGLTTSDKVIFRKLRDGELEMEDIDLPWRYVLTDSIDQTTTISDSIIINLDEAQKLDIHITSIYFGDPLGQFCN